jgi:hypothetical protein
MPAAFAPTVPRAVAHVSALALRRADQDSHKRQYVAMCALPCRSWRQPIDKFWDFKSKAASPRCALLKRTTRKSRSRRGDSFTLVRA